MLATLARLPRRELQQDRQGHRHGGEVTWCRSDRRERGHRKGRRPKSILDRESQRPESDSSSPNRWQHVKSESYVSRFCVLGSGFWVWVLGLGSDSGYFSGRTPNPEPERRTRNQEPGT